MRVQTRCQDQSGSNAKIYNPVEYKGTVKVNGEIKDVSRKVYQRNDIDFNYFDETTGLTNLERMQAGKPPIGSDGNPIQLHHILQKEVGPMVEIREITHQEYYSQLHGLIEDGASIVVDVARTVDTLDDTVKIADELTDAAKVVDKVDDITDAAMAVNAMDEANAAVKAVDEVNDVADAVKTVEKLDDVVEGGKYSAFGEMPDVDGMRYRDWNYERIREMSIHNPDADTLTLGKYRPSKNIDGTDNWKVAGADSYNVIAEKNGNMYFDMKDGLYDNVMENYKLSYQDMFDEFNTTALDKAISEGKTIRFSHNPELTEYAGSFTDQEWKYLQKHGNYLYLREEGGFWYAEK